MADEKKNNAKPDVKPEAAAEAPKEPPAPPAGVKPEEALDPDLSGLKAKAAERDEFLDLAQRTRAELINYRKRVERDRAEWADRAVGDFALSILPVLDDFDRALREAESSKDVKALLEGFRQVDRKLHVVFKAAGLEAFSPQGKPFDPAEHEAVVVEETEEHPHHAVSEVTRKGWRLRGRVLRPAQVKVARKPEPKPAEKPGEPKDAGKKERTNDADV